MKFVVDAMLGKVALWLRLTGNDTVYSATLDDDEALVISSEEERILLTSDEGLYNRAVDRNLPTMLVRGSVDEQVAGVFRRYEIRPLVDPSKSRCSKCNGILDELDEENKDQVKELVYDQTFNHYDTFWLCRDCRSVFFQGGYWENIQNYMKRIESMIAEWND
ncbi:MAG: Mut7-C RNAse domain-containing protein [Candidatus Thorarchaeota archaeon]